MKTNQELIVEAAQAVQQTMGAIGGQDPNMVKVRAEVIQAWIERSFYRGQNSKFFFLSADGQLVQFTDRMVADYITESLGLVADCSPDGINDDLFNDVDNEKEIGKREGQLLRASTEAVLKQIRLGKQREQLAYEVDMFAEEARIDCSDPEHAKIIFPFRPFPTVGTQNDLIAKDYSEEHFPEARNLLEFVVASRFASNRKRSYCWLQAVSDFGKDLMFGTLESIGAATSISMSEAVACMNGKTVGRTPDTLLHSFICWFDEFRTVNPEIKMVQDSITISAKYQPTAKMPVYAKIFTSADDVGALAGDQGVEDQMANRFCHLTGDHPITSRPMWSVPDYPNAVKFWITSTFNDLIETYRAEGRAAASARADQYLSDFYQQHGIEKSYERYSVSARDRIYQFALDLYTARRKYELDIGAQYPSTEERRFAGLASEHLIDYEGETYLKCFKLLWSQWVHINVDHSARVGMDHHSKAMKDEFMALDRDMGYKLRKLGGPIGVRTVRLPSEQACRKALGVPEESEETAKTGVRGSTVINPRVSSWTANKKAEFSSISDQADDYRGQDYD